MTPRPVTALCSSCRRAARVLVALRSPRGPYQLCVPCLGPDAAQPAPTSDVQVADRNARAAAVADVLAWFAEHADRIEGWTPPPTRQSPDDGHSLRGQA